MWIITPSPRNDSYRFFKQNFTWGYEFKDPHLCLFIYANTILSLIVKELSATNICIHTPTHTHKIQCSADSTLLSWCCYLKFSDFNVKGQTKLHKTQRQIKLGFKKLSLGTKDSSFLLIVFELRTHYIELHPKLLPVQKFRLS